MLSRPLATPPPSRVSLPLHLIEQLSFPGFSPARALPIDIFATVLAPPNAGLCEIAQRLRARHGLRGEPLGPGRFHISLHGFDHRLASPREIVRRAREAAASVVMEPFSVTFDRALTIKRTKPNHAFVLGCAPGQTPLHDLHHHLHKALVKAGLGRHVSPAFTPHVTLLYDRTVVLEHPIDPLTWTVENVSLVLSLVERHRNIPLGTWSLS